MVKQIKKHLGTHSWHLPKSKIMHRTQFDFQKVSSVDHVITQLLDQIYKSFENSYTLGI